MKICPQCGQQSEDYTQSCNRCGYQFNQSQQPQQYNQQQYANQQYSQQQNYQPQQYVNQQNYQFQQYTNQQSYQPQQYNQYQQYPQQQYSSLAQPAKKSKTKFIIIGVCAVAIIAIVVILVIVLGGNKHGYKSYEDAIEAYFKAEQGDVDAMLSLFPEEYIEKISKTYETMYNSSFQEYMEKSVQEEIESYKNRYGDDFHIEYEIVETEDLSESELSSMQSSLSLYASMDVTIANGKEVKVKATYTGSKDTYERTRYIDVYQIDGKWYTLG